MYRIKGKRGEQSICYKKILLLLSTAIILLVFIGGCVSPMTPIQSKPATVGQATSVHDDLVSLPRPKEKIIAAVYNFEDKTGQFKSTAQGETNSKAVTQGATSMLIKALEDSQWFIVVEREGLTNLLNERKIIDIANTSYKDESGNPLNVQPPLLYANIIIEGGIIAYESNILTGGIGVKYFGLGAHTQFRKDQVTVYLRAVSTRSGRILKTVYTTKSIFSTLVDEGMYRYVRVKRLLEIEAGFSTNEPPQMCVLEAIEKGVQGLIIEGIMDKIWLLENPDDIQTEVIQGYLKEKEEAERVIPLESVQGGRNSWGFGIDSGIQQYRGDYSESEINNFIEAHVSYGFSPCFSALLKGGVGKLSSEENFETTLTNIDLGITYKMLARKRMTPYLFLGGGILNFWIKDSEGKDRVREDPGWGWKPTITTRLGAEYFMSRMLGIDVHFRYSYTFTDQIDGVMNGNMPDMFWGIGFGITYYLNSKR